MTRPPRRSARLRKSTPPASVVHDLTPDDIEMVNGEASFSERETSETRSAASNACVSQRITEASSLEIELGESNDDSDDDSPVNHHTRTLLSRRRQATQTKSLERNRADPMEQDTTSLASTDDVTSEAESSDASWYSLASLEQNGHVSTDSENDLPIKPSRKRAVTPTSPSDNPQADQPSPRKKLASRLGRISLDQQPSGESNVHGIQGSVASTETPDDARQELADQEGATTQSTISPMEYSSHRIYMAYSESGDSSTVSAYLKKQGWLESKFLKDVLIARPAMCVSIREEGIFITSPSAAGVDRCVEFMAHVLREDGVLFEEFFLSPTEAQEAPYSGATASESDSIIYLYPYDEPIDSPEASHEHLEQRRVPKDFEHHSCGPDSLQLARKEVVPFGPFRDALKSAQIKFREGKPLPDDFCSSCGTMHPVQKFFHKNKWLRLCYRYTGLSLISKTISKTITKHPIYIECREEENPVIQDGVILRPCLLCRKMMPHSHWIRSSGKSVKKMRYVFSTCNASSQVAIDKRAAKKSGTYVPGTRGRGPTRKFAIDDKAASCSHCYQKFPASTVVAHREVCKTKHQFCNRCYKYHLLKNFDIHYGVNRCFRVTDSPTTSDITLEPLSLHCPTCEKKVVDLDEHWRDSEGCELKELENIGEAVAGHVLESPPPLTKYPDIFRHFLEVVEFPRRQQSVQDRAASIWARQTDVEFLDDDLSSEATDLNTTGLQYMLQSITMDPDMTAEHKKLNLYNNQKTIDNYSGSYTSKEDLINLGKNCLGAGDVTRSGHGLVTDSCPLGTILDFDTGLVIAVHPEKCLRMASRCSFCYTKRRMRIMLANYSNLPVDTCILSDCDEAATRGPFCEEHAPPGLHTNDPAITLKLLQDRYETAVTSQWAVWPNLEDAHQRYYDIMAGKRPPESLAILDLEFPVQGAGNRDVVYEETLLGAVSDDILIASRITDAYVVGDQNDYWIQRTNRAKALLYKAPAPPEMIKETRVEFIKRLRALNITKDTIVVVWHNNKEDLARLRRFVGREADEILPQLSQCVSLLHGFKHVLGPDVPLKLELLFPTVYPKHELIGRNHLSDIDCRQTRLLFMAYVWNTLPLNRRSKHWEGHQITSLQQTKPGSSNFLMDALDMNKLDVDFGKIVTGIASSAVKSSEFVGDDSQNEAERLKQTILASWQKQEAFGAELKAVRLHYNASLARSARTYLGPEQQDCAEFLTDLFSHVAGFLTQIFEPLSFVVKKTCSTCTPEASPSDNRQILELPITQGQGPQDLVNMMEWGAWENLERCTTQECSGNAQISSEPESLPDNIVVQLKRFYYDTGRAKGSTKKIHDLSSDAYMLILEKAIPSTSTQNESMSFNEAIEDSTEVISTAAATLSPKIVDTVEPKKKKKPRAPYPLGIKKNIGHRQTRLTGRATTPLDSPPPRQLKKKKEKRPSKKPKAQVQEGQTKLSFSPSSPPSRLDISRGNHPEVSESDE
ncbi:hypothetical protein J4E80_010011 [Alternaria sp. BMP 0032]|nr:hypothetical protein J4E80_010011 [Alternaria sp. BMP 0032]